MKINSTLIRECLLKIVYFSIATSTAIKTICCNAMKIHKHGFKSLFWYVDPMFLNVGFLDNKKIYRMTTAYKLPRCKHVRKYLFEKTIYRIINLIK